MSMILSLILESFKRVNVSSDGGAEMLGKGAEEMEEEEGLSCGQGPACLPLPSPHLSAVANGHADALRARNFSLPNPPMPW